MLALLAVTVLTGLGPARAADEATPLTEFKSQFKDVRKNLETMNGKIQNGAKTIETLSDAQSARQQVEQLQALVSEALGLVSDNGDFAVLGAKALAYSRGKLEQMRKETKFDEKERKGLEQRWERITAETEKAVTDLTNAGRDFAQLLRVIQTRGDYAKEILEAENAEAMIKVIQNLASEVRNGSEALRAFIRSLTSARRMIRRVIFGAILAVGIAGCDASSGSGFVEIKRKATLGRDDVVVLNDAPVAELAGKDSAIIKQRVGTAKLELKRGERAEKLCEFPVRKNRVVTVTLTSANTLLRCAVQT